MEQTNKEPQIVQSLGFLKAGSSDCLVGLEIELCGFWTFYVLSNLIFALTTVAALRFAGVGPSVLTAASSGGGAAPSGFLF